MIIHRLTALFSRHSQDALQLEPGLNILQLQPGTESVPWTSFFLDLFFGGNLASYPGVVPLAGKALCKCGNTELTLIRRTGDFSHPLDDFLALLSDSGERAPALTPENCGHALLGVERNALEQSIFIGPVPTGGEAISIPVRPEKNAAELRRQLDELQKNVTSLEGQESELTSQLVSGLEPQDAASQMELLREKREKAAMAEKKAATIAGKLAAAMVPGNSAIARFRKAIFNLLSLQKQIDQARTQQAQASDALQKVEKNVRSSPFNGKTAEEARKTAQSPTITPVNRRLPTSSIVLLLAGVLLAVLAFWQILSRSGSTGLAVIAVPVILWFTVFGARMLWLQDLEKRRKAMMQRRFGTDKPDAVGTLAEEYARLLASRQDAEKTLAAATARLESMSRTYSDKEQEILAEIQRFAPVATDITTADRILQQSAGLRKKLSNAEKESRAAREEYEDLLKSLEEKSRTGKLPQESSGELSGETIDETDGKTDTDADTDVDTDSDAEDADAKSAEDTEDADAEGADADAEGAEDANLDAEDADKDTETGTGPETETEASNPRTQRLEEIRQSLSAARNQMESLSEDLLSIQGYADLEKQAVNRALLNLLPVYQDDENAIPLQLTQRTAEIFRQMPSSSSGLYLAARLAISELAVPLNRNVPLFLDNSLTTFSDEDAALILTWLRSQAESRQIILFTDSSREAAFFRRDAAVTCQTIFPSQNWFRMEEDAPGGNSPLS